MTLAYPWLVQPFAEWCAGFERLHHAWLLQGSAGIGKGALAHAMAAALLCEAPDHQGDACGQCPGCHLMAEGHHPDFRHLTPPDEEDDKKTRKLPVINIEQVREVIDFVWLSSHRGGRRVVLIEPADALNTAAANAILKVLEEPPEGVVFLLVTSRPGRLLPTIRSRCRVFNVPLPPAVMAREWLATHGLASPDARLAFHGGAPLAAQADEHAAIMEIVLGQLARGRALDVLDAAQEILKPLGKKTSLQPVWDIVMRWLVDLAQVALAGSGRYFPAEGPKLEKLASQLDFDSLFRFHQTISADLAVLHHTLDNRLLLESWLLAYRELFRGSRESRP